MGEKKGVQKGCPESAKNIGGTQQSEIHFYVQIVCFQGRRLEFHHKLTIIFKYFNRQNNKKQILGGHLEYFSVEPVIRSKFEPLVFWIFPQISSPPIRKELFKVPTTRFPKDSNKPGNN